MSAFISMFDQIMVRVSCDACGPAEVTVGQLKDRITFACSRCGLDMRLDREPLKSHLAMLITNAAEVDARRRRSGYVIRRA